MVNRWFVAQLFSELQELTSRNVISEENAESIKNYYNEKIKEEENLVKQKDAKLAEKKAAALKKVPLILSAIAAFFIFGGIVSIIAYNWHGISREAKTAAAFIIAFVPAGLWIICKNKIKNFWFKEFCSVLWTLLFGSAVAFISQIYRLPGNTTGFFFVWALSAVLITYAMNSYGAFGLGAFFTFLYVCSAQYMDWNSAVLFYPLFLALLPFAMKMPFGNGCAAVYLAILLGNVLEKSIPGFWIVCYFSLTSVVLSLAVIKKDKVLKILALTGLGILSVMLCHRHFWYDTGLSFFRFAHKYDMAGTIGDIALAVVLFAGAVAGFVKSFRKDRLISLLHIIPLVFTAYFAVKCFISGEGIFLIEFAPYFFGTVFVVLALIFGFKKSRVGFFILFALSMQCFTGIPHTTFGLLPLLIFVNTAAFGLVGSAKIPQPVKNMLFTVLSTVLIIMYRFNNGVFPSMNCYLSYRFLLVYAYIFFGAVMLVPAFYCWKSLKETKNLVSLLLPLSSVFILVYETFALNISVYLIFNLVVCVTALGLLILKKEMSMIVPLVLMLLDFNFTKADSAYSGMLHSCGSIVFLIGAGLYFLAYFDIKKYGGPIIETVVCLVFSILVFVSKYYHVLESDYVHAYKMLDVLKLLNLVLIAVFALSMLILTMRKKIEFNYSILAFMILCLLPVFGECRAAVFAYNLSWNLAFLSYCVVEIVLAVRKKSLVLTNIYSAWLSFVFFLRFLLEDTGLVAKSVCFILCGVLIIFVNVYISRTSGKSKKEVSNEN